jgi:hypothetical protein
MKRRKRKRSSKAATPPKIRSNAEEPASPAGISYDAENHKSSLSIRSDAENLACSLNVAIDTENPANSLNIPSDAEQLTSAPGTPDAIDLTSFLNTLTDVEKPVSSSNIASDSEVLTGPSQIPSNAGNPADPSLLLAGADRRTHPRYEFIAAAEIVGAESGAPMKMRVRDLSQQGCYVDTTDALPLGTVTNVRIAKGAQLFEARARVVYSRAAKGMGLVFTDVEPEQLLTLGTWLSESRETSWLAANRRRSQRVLVAVPVRVSGQTGAGLPFEEETYTRAISAHGALILVSALVHRGQRLIVSNVQTKGALECVVAHIDRRQSDHPQVGVEFTLPNPLFWHVAFPPKDWTPRHPDAKSRIKAR